MTKELLSYIALDKDEGLDDMCHGIVQNAARLYVDAMTREHVKVKNFPEEIISLCAYFQELRKTGFDNVMGAVIRDFILKNYDESIALFLKNNPGKAERKAAAEALESFMLIAGIACASGAIGDSKDYKVRNAVSILEIMLNHNDIGQLSFELKNMFNAGKVPAAVSNDIEERLAKAFYVQCKRQYKDLKVLVLKNQTLVKYQERKEPSEGEKTRNVSRFKFEDYKKEGVEAGFIGKKKIKAGDDKTKQKYEYQWMIKWQNPLDCIIEKLAADIYRHFLGDNAPKIRLLLSTNQNQILLASRMFVFQTVSSAYPAANFKTEFQRNETYLALDKGLYIKALNVWLGDFDRNRTNDGVVDKGTGKREAAIVDFGRSLHFRAGYDWFTEEGNPHVLPGACDVKKGEPYTPEVLVRSWHRGHYGINSPNFQRDKFAVELRHVAREVKEKPNNLAHVVQGSVKEIQHECSKLSEGQRLEVEAGLARIAEGTTLKNLGDKLFDSLMERAAMLETFARNIVIQESIEIGDAINLSEILEKHPEAVRKPIKWLTPDNDEIIHPPSTILEYAQQVNPMDQVDEFGKAHSIDGPIEKAIQKAKLADELLSAVIRGDYAQVCRLLKNGVDPNIPGTSGDMPLLVAVVRGGSAITEELLEKGADANTPKWKNMTALEIAQKFEYEHIEKLLLPHLKPVPVKQDATKPQIVTNIPTPLKGVTKFNPESYKDAVLGSFREKIPNAQRHEHFMGIAAYVYDVVYGHKAIPEAKKLDAISNILNGIYKDIPQSKEQAELQNSPLFFSKTGHIHRASHWGHKIDAMVDKVAGKEEQAQPLPNWSRKVGGKADKVTGKKEEPKVSRTISTKKHRPHRPETSQKAVERLDKGKKPEGEREK